MPTQALSPHDFGAPVQITGLAELQQFFTGTRRKLSATLDSVAQKMGAERLIWANIGGRIWWRAYIFKKHGMRIALCFPRIGTDNTPEHDVSIYLIGAVPESRLKRLIAEFNRRRVALHNKHLRY